MTNSFAQAIAAAKRGPGITYQFSQGVQIVTQALNDAAMEAGNGWKRTNSVLVALGGAHTILPTNAVACMYVLRNSPDLLTGPCTVCILNCVKPGREG